MTPRPAPVLAMAPSLTVHESAGTWIQPSRDLPSKIGLVCLSTASGRAGGRVSLSAGGSAVSPRAAALQMIPAAQVIATVAPYHERAIDSSPRRTSCLKLRRWDDDFPGQLDLPVGQH